MNSTLNWTLVCVFPGSARQGDELKVEQGVKDLRSLSLPNMKPSAGQSPYILTPGSEKAEHASLGRREGDDLLVSHTASSILSSGCGKLSPSP